ncbi:MAG: hypothetical protein ACKO96_48905, partial [Flammeovirgaceae bacterium]
MLQPWYYCSIGWGRRGGYMGNARLTTAPQPYPHRITTLPYNNGITKLPRMIGTLRIEWSSEVILGRFGGDTVLFILCARWMYKLHYQSHD